MGPQGSPTQQSFHLFVVIRDIVKLLPLLQPAKVRLSRAPGFPEQFNPFLD